MCAVIALFKTHPQDVVDTFSLEELEEFANETEPLMGDKIEGIYKDLLDMSK